MKNNYFARRNKIEPSNGADTTIVSNGMVRGKLESIFTQAGKSSSGKWLVFELSSDNGDKFSVFFDYGLCRELDYYYQFRGKYVKLRVVDGKPAFDESSNRSVAEIREELLIGVANGRVDKDDLPVLMEFSKGELGHFEKWNLFKNELELVGLEKKEAEIEKKLAESQERLDLKNKKIEELAPIHKQVDEMLTSMMNEMCTALFRIQGEEYLTGDAHGCVNIGTPTDRLIRIGNGYTELAKAIDMMRPKKGVFVIDGDKIHKIHHAYFDEKDRVFLIGSSEDFLKTKPEKVQEIIDKIYDIIYNDKNDKNSKH